MAITKEQVKEVSKDMALTLSQLAISMAADASKKVATEITGVYAEYAGKHTSKIGSLPNEITQKSLQVFNEKKLTLGEILKTLNSNEDEESDKEMEEGEKKATSNFINKTKEKINKTKEKVQKITNAANTYIPMVLSYIDNGPTWVQTQLDKQINGWTQNIRNDLNVRWKEIDYPAYKEFIDATGEKIGTRMANQFNEKLKKKAIKQQNKTRKIASKAKTKLKTVAQKAKILIAAKTGIYIPV